MLSFVEAAPDGRIVAAGTYSTAQELDALRELCRPGNKLIGHIAGHLPPAGTLYCDGDGVRPMPSRPSQHHTFNYTTKTWELDVADAWAQVRRERDDLMAKTDWVALRAADLGQPVPQPWLDYRQALRDITEQADPLNITWPVAPN